MFCATIVAMLRCYPIRTLHVVVVTASDSTTVLSRSIFLPSPRIHHVSMSLGACVRHEDFLSLLIRSDDAGTQTPFIIRKVRKLVRISKGTERGPELFNPYMGILQALAQQVVSR